MFNVDTKLGKLYVFDIQRTCREVHDHARRVLHSRGIDIRSPHEIPDLTNELECLLLTPEETKSKMEKEVTNRIAEAFTCRVCMDSSIDTAFFPCGHVACCDECAEK